MKIAKKWLSGCLIMLVVACQANPTQTGTPSNTQAACKNLHKVIDIDDLLKQMYDNLDSQCLFEMPTAELEKIWGIRIFDFVEFHNTAVNNLTPEQFEIYNSKFNPVIEDRGQHLNNNNAIYLEKNGGGNFAPSAENNPEVIWFQIHTTPAHRKAYSQYTWFSGSVDLGQFPKYLPEPSEQRLPERKKYPLPPSNERHGKGYIPRKAPENTVYENKASYIWVSHQQNLKRPMLVIKTESRLPQAETISLYNFYQPK